jgi:hypothetical protein
LSPAGLARGLRLALAEATRWRRYAGGVWPAEHCQAQRRLWLGRAWGYRRALRDAQVAA